METIVITGANRGIGLELTRQYLAAGDRVIATCRLPAEAVELRQLAPQGPLSILALEIADELSTEAFRQAIGGTAVDVLINNAGVLGGSQQALGDMDYAQWLHTFEVNTIAPFRITSALLENLRQSTRPRVIALSSQMGALSRKSKGSFAYRSSKAALNKVMQVLALELEALGIVVCPVHPGWVRTDMGGPGADISVQESAAGLVRLVRGLTLADTGRFWTWDGQEHAW